MMKWFETTREHKFAEKKVMSEGHSSNILKLTGRKRQTVRGFGACFNELGAIALKKTDRRMQEQILKNLFGSDGLNLSFCRIPIGASDYAEEWYSCDETDGDYELKDFSIERDRRYLIPYIHEAQAHHEGRMTFFASPWSPPAWMKTTKAYNNGIIRMEEKVLRAYAKYFQKFVESYKEEGIEIAQVHVQNEVFSDQKFPSCLWSAENMRIFIRDYLGPLFDEENMNTDIFLGTLNGPEEMTFTSTDIALNHYNKYVDTILFDDKARQYIKGVGYQWAGRNVIARTHDSFPELEYIQTENECGGSLADKNRVNTWEYAQYIFSMICHYFQNGVTAYIYWNMILEPGGTSTWGWHQNSMITVDPISSEVFYNPEYYVMKHFASFIQPQAVRLETQGHWNSAAAAFENPDGNMVIAVQNALDRPEKITLVVPEGEVTVTLEPNSFHTFIF